MRDKLFKSILATFCVFVVSISSAIALKNINITYAATTYSVTVYANGGTFTKYPGSTSKVFSGLNGITYFSCSGNSNCLGLDASTVTKSGCTLNGWKVGSATSTQTWNQYVEPKDDGVKLYANWSCTSTPSINMYSVSFNLNGGSGNFPIQSITSGAKIPKPASIPTKTDYIFKYWSTSLNGLEYNFNTPVTTNMVLYAVWQKKEVPKTYIISFDTQGGSQSYSSKTITEGNKVSNPGSPTKTNYTFQYWSKSPNGSAYNFNESVNSSFKLYAVWKQNPTNNGGGTNVTPPTPQTPPSNPEPTTTYYEVKFDLNGGKGTVDAQKIEKDQKATKPSKNPTKENASFSGWYTSNSCKSDAKYDFNKKVTSDITLYACYTAKLKISLSKIGLPFISSEAITIKQNATLEEYNMKKILYIFDSTTYSLQNNDNCVEYLSDIRDKEQAEKSCKNLEKTLTCSSDNCYGNKYIILSDTLTEEIIYLAKTNVIKIDYDKYEYLGLYRDRTCKDEYDYSSKVTKSLELYECYNLNNEVIENPKKEKKGISKGLKTIIVMLIVLSILGLIVFYFIRKSKIANSVD